MENDREEYVPQMSRGRGFPSISKRAEGSHHSENSSGHGTFDSSRHDDRQGSGGGLKYDEEKNKKDDNENGFCGFRGGRGGRGSRNFANEGYVNDGGFRGISGGRGMKNSGNEDNENDGGFRGSSFGRGGRSFSHEENENDGGFRGSRGGGSGSRNFKNEEDAHDGGFRGGSRRNNDDENEDDTNFGHSFRGRGGGGRGSYSGGGFRGSRNQGDENGGSSDRRCFGRKDEDDGNDFGSFGGRGGGRGRGRGGDRGGRDNYSGGGGGGGGGGDKESEKPREMYIPPELPNNEKLFETGVEVGINFSQYEALDVRVTGEEVPPAINSFEESGLRKHLLDNITKCKYTVPTPIQKHAIPIIMANRDVMGCAQTGSGKTAAFMLPIINKLLGESRDFSNMSEASYVEPRAVVMLPTRELVVQIYQESRKFAYDSVLKVQMLYGGTWTGHQLKQLFNGCDILVATPGRLLDFLGKGKILFSSVQFVVLDEADRMLGMGFRDDIEKVLRHESMVPTGERQTILFSATFPRDIQELAVNYLSNYVFITVGIIGGACTDVEQHFVQVAKSDKRTKLMELLQKEVDLGTLQGILVFVEEKKTADFVAALLSENDFPTTSIHGDRLQRERELAISDFVSGRMGILVGTSVAARGLDMKIVKHVINYDLPKDIHEYIHRIGRTGRLGNKGKATAFFDPRYDKRILDDLLRTLNQAKQNVPEWLEGSNEEGGVSYGPASNFGGQDIRHFSDVSGLQGASKPVEEDEEWE